MEVLERFIGSQWKGANGRERLSKLVVSTSYKLAFLMQIILTLLSLLYLFILHKPQGKSQDLPPLALRIDYTFQVNNQEFHDDFNYFKYFKTPSNGSMSEEGGNRTASDLAISNADRNRYAKLTKDYIDAETKYLESYFEKKPKSGKAPIELKRHVQTIMTEINQNMYLVAVNMNCTLEDPSLNGKANPSQSKVPKNMQSIWQDDVYIYWNFIPDEKEYPIYGRKRKSQSSSLCSDDVSTDPIHYPSQVLIDFNTILPKGLPFYMIGTVEILNEHVMSYSIDLNGSERFDLYVYNITSKTVLYGPIKDTYYSVRWSLNDSWIYYNIVSSKWGVPLGTGRAGPFDGSLSPTTQDVYWEQDISLTTEIDQTNDSKFLFVKVSGLTISEYKAIITTSPSQFKLVDIIPRKSNIFYDLSFLNGYFYARTNSAGAFNFRIIRFKDNVTDPSTSSSNEQVLVENSSVMIMKMEIFANNLVYWYRSRGQPSIRGIELTNGTTSSSSFQIYQPSVSSYSLTQDISLDIDGRFYRSFHSNCFTFANSSFIHPTSLYSFNFKTKSTSLLLSTDISGGAIDFSSAREEFIMVPSYDGVEIPISYVAPISTIPSPLFLIGYGAYGGYQDPYFDSSYWALLKNNYTVAICHPRGDGDLGTEWWTSGKTSLKANTFYDVQSCIDGLVDRKLVDGSRIAVKGRSAGGLVAGNQFLNNPPPKSKDSVRPKVVVANVPFIDPIYDLIDSKVPWTAYEWVEWGNPNADASILKVMKTYSPYHNIRQMLDNIPALYVSSGLHDSRVPFWEPLKFVAKMRTSQQAANATRNIVMRVSDSGHFEASNVETTSEWLAFVLFNN